MKKQILKELNDIKYLFNYNRGKIISEQEQFDDEEEFVDYDDIDYGDMDDDMDDDEEEYYPELRIPHDMPSYKTKYRNSDDEDDEWEEVDLDTETDWDQLEEDECTECGDMYEIELDEKLYGNQTKLDKNKNGRIDKEDFKMLRKQQDEEENSVKMDVAIPTELKAIYARIKKIENMAGIQMRMPFEYVME